MNVKKFITITLISLLLIVIFALPSFYFDQQSIKNILLTITPQGPLAPLFIFLFLGLATSIGLPRQIAAFSAGYLLGMWQGSIFATLAATLGCFITLTTARQFLHQYITNKYPQKLTTISNFFCHQTFIKILIIRLLPLGSNLLTNILAGIARVPTKPYLLGSSIGFLPQMFIFAMAGDGVRLDSTKQIMISAMLFLLAILLSLTLHYFSKNFRKTELLVAGDK